jgi:ribosome-associated protein
VSKTEQKTPEKKTPKPKRFKMNSDLKCAIEAAQNKKAMDLLCLDLRELASFTDYFLICTGTSTPQNQAICNEIEKKLKEQRRSPVHIEGYQKAEWVLMDYSDFLVHIFTPVSRSFYDLARLWREAPRLEIPES